MKVNKQIISFIGILCLLLLPQSLFSQGSTSSQDYLTIQGIVHDEMGEPLQFVYVTVKGFNLATVTNQSGEFTLKIENEMASGEIEFTHIGYKNKIVPVSDFKERGRRNIIDMELATIMMQELVVIPTDAEAVVEMAISKIRDNYETVPNLMTAFYRETIKRNRTYTSIAEAVLEIFKAPYNNDFRFDGTRIYKGRKGNDVQKSDTLLFKLQGGPITLLDLDMVKNSYGLFEYGSMKDYNYSINGIVEIDERSHLAINFSQKESVEDPLFYGTMYIDRQTFALTEAEFAMNLSDIEAATRNFIRKQPSGVQAYPESTMYRVKFHEQDGKWYLSYARAEVTFKVNWKKKLFNTTYSTMSEMAITDRTDQEVIKFAGKERLKYTDIFSEKVSDFTDDDFWGDYNIIEPDQSIETAIRRIGRKLKFSEREPEE